MAKTFYWVGGATGANVLEAYNWNNPKNWIVQNSTFGGGLGVSQLNQGTNTSTTTSSSNPANRFNVSTGTLGAITDVSLTCPGIGDVVIIGELPSIGNNTPTTVQAPLLFGGCGVTSAAGWTGSTPYATWSGASVASGTGTNIGLSTLTIKNNYLPNTTTPVYPFEWVGGGITSGNVDVVNWLKNKHPSEDILSYSSLNTSDLRVLVKDEVKTECMVSFDTTKNAPLKVSLLFKGGVKTRVASPSGAINVVKTKYTDTSSHIALGLFRGAFDIVTIKEPKGSPATRYISTAECILNEVYVNDYPGSLYLDQNSKINKMELNDTMWMGDIDEVLQTFIIESSFVGSNVRTTLGYVGLLPADHSSLKVGPCAFIHPNSSTQDARLANTKYNVRTPPTLIVGSEIGVTLLEDTDSFQKIPYFTVTGKNEDLTSFLNGRWHIQFKGSTNINYMKSTFGILKTSRYAPLNTKIKIGTVDMYNQSEITFTKNCPIVDAGDQDIWYMGQLTDKFRGGLTFLDSTGIIYGSRGIVAANTFLNKDKNIDSNTGEIDYNVLDIQGSVTTAQI